MFQGAYTAIVTPFNRGGSVDYGKLRELIGLQIAGGIDGIVPVGTTGESPTLDFPEQRSRSSPARAPIRRPKPSNSPGTRSRRGPTARCR